MNNDKDFYENFNTDSKKSFSFKTGILVPFLSGIIGAGLVVGLFFGFSNNRTTSTNINVEEQANSLKENNDATANYISLNNYSDTAVFAANKVLPSIVGITVEYSVTSNFMQSISQIGTAKGSGIIMSKDGYILTNNHIINSSDSSSFYSVSEATNIYVYLYNDETAYPATIIGNDSQTDLAVIKIDKDNLTAAELGNSDSLKIGEFAMAIGNPLGMQSSVTSGIISALNRTVNSSDGNTYTLIQTDAAINAGNSGGALVNAEGKVVGLNTLKLSGTGIEGMGFAIPINDITEIYKQLIDNGKVLRPYIGISGIDLDEISANYYQLPQGIYVKEISPNSPAANSDLKKGDIIVAIEGTEVSSINELNEVKNKKNIGDTVTLDVYRNKDKLKIKITLGETP